MLYLMLALAAVTGSLQTSTSEEFFQGRIERSHMVLVSDANVVCEADLMDDRGAISCDDGREGYVSFLGDVGSGHIEGEPLTLTRN